MARAERKAKPASRKIDTQDPFENRVLALLAGDGRADAAADWVADDVKNWEKDQFLIFSDDRKRFEIELPGAATKATARNFADAMTKCFEAEGLQLTYGRFYDRGTFPILEMSFPAEITTKTEAEKYARVLEKVCAAAIKLEKGMELGG